ncbi:MAG: hypothetical protein Q4D36_09510, partial [Bacteroidales bacterium]|nr:hypothetical protein [Bacteroidales bacterium]
MEYDLFVIEGDTFHSEELIQKMQPFERKFGQTLNQDSDKKETAKSDKSLKTSEKTFSPDEVYNNINININKKNKDIKEKISSSSEEEIQKKDASPKSQVSEEEDIFVKPVISESYASVSAAKPAKQPPTSTVAPSATPPNTSQPADSEPTPGWETWVDMLGKDESWKKLMSQR